MESLRWRAQKGLITECALQKEGEYIAKEAISVLGTLDSKAVDGGLHHKPWTNFLRNTYSN
jgi:hypothetical protein